MRGIVKNGCNVWRKGASTTRQKAWCDEVKVTQLLHGRKLDVAH